MLRKHIKQWGLCNYKACSKADDGLILDRNSFNWHFRRSLLSCKHKPCCVLHCGLLLKQMALPVSLYLSTVQQNYSQHPENGNASLLLFVMMLSCIKHTVNLRLMGWLLL